MSKRVIRKTATMATRELPAEMPLVWPVLLFYPSVIQDKFCGIINISVEGLHDVMTEDPETGTYKE